MDEIATAKSFRSKDHGAFSCLRIRDTLISDRFPPPRESNVRCIGRSAEEDLMRKREPRWGEDRRSGVDRRKFDDPNYRGLERRSGPDGRSGKERRKSP
jgi:hypothetical protein